MNVRWELTALSFLDQLSNPERRQVEKSVKQAAENWQTLGGAHLSRLQGVREPEDDAPLYALRAGNDLRVILQKHGDAIVVVDIARRSQIDWLRSIQRAS